MEYEVVVINRMIDHTSNQEVMGQLGQIWDLKKRSYDKFHNSKYYPVGLDDFVGINIAIRSKENKDILIAFKVIPYSQCSTYLNIEFPFYSIISSATDEITKQKGKKIITDLIEEKVDFSYSGGWTENFKYKGIGLSGEFKELYTAIHYWTHIHYELKAITGIAFVGERPYEFFTEEWGLKPVSMNSYTISFVPHQECRMIFNRVENLSEYTMKCAKKWKHLWESRIDLTAEELVKKVA